MKKGFLLIAALGWILVAFVIEANGLVVSKGSVDFGAKQPGKTIIETVDFTNDESSAINVYLGLSADSDNFLKNRLEYCWSVWGCMNPDVNYFPVINSNGMGIENGETITLYLKMKIPKGEHSKVYNGSLNVVTEGAGAG